jgi:hypothetical protein
MHPLTRKINSNTGIGTPIAQSNSIPILPSWFFIMILHQYVLVFLVNQAQPVVHPDLDDCPEEVPGSSKSFLDEPVLGAPM